ncbi:MAG: GNAT family N-acetyltransferase [Deltaproteobacteria bacterium]|nr:GNAT family N-acetyltransferase [Deltaproteobacteria bacterium]MBW2071559.1 GNAT family N-acetyltransferase [Deltaproteobacteria bacterium]
MFENYPKEVILKEGTRCTLRPMIRDDQDALYRFFLSLPEKDRKYLRHDPTDRRLIEKWCRELDYGRVFPILAEHEGKIVANATLHRQTFGWGKHVGEIRVTIAADFQQQGLGSLLLEELSAVARKMELEKLCARVVTAQPEVIKVFEKNGFIQATVLKNFIKDVQEHDYKDIAILSKDLK